MLLQTSAKPYPIHQLVLSFLKMAQLRLFSVAAAVSGVFLLLSTSGTEAVIVELGKVKCILVVKFNEVFERAHHDCWIKLQTELKGKEKEEQKQFPFNATIEEFEWDDHCLGQCIYKTAGILSGEANLPGKKDSVTIFGKGKQLSDDRYKVIISAWDQCLDISTEIAKAKEWKQCQIVTHHQHCFNLKMQETVNNLQVDC